MTQGQFKFYSYKGYESGILCKHQSNFKLTKWKFSYIYKMIDDMITDPESKKESKPIIIRNITDLQRLKLEKLMKNPDKPVIIPEKPKERGVPVVPDFVRNVMGSSAGAGSGEFHVYRHLRRKEYARQKYMKEKGEREILDNEYHRKLEENRRKAEERTAKKRQKRLKKKQTQKTKKRARVTGHPNSKGNTSSGSSSDNSSATEENDSEPDKHESHKVENTVSKDGNEADNDRSAEQDEIKAQKCEHGTNYDEKEVENNESETSDHVLKSREDK